MASPSRLRIGTRGSLLATTQSQWVADRIRACWPEVSVDVVIIRTTGDRRQDVAFAEVGTKGMFVKELEEALLARDVDLAVHSMKDVPGELPEGLTIAAVPPRVDPRDAVVSAGVRLADLPPGARVGTSSARRQAQIRAARPDLSIEELRGNLDTRLRRLDAGDYDAIVVAVAGLERIGRADRIVQRLDPSVCVPAPGQGALAIETRADDTETLAVVGALGDTDATIAVAAERAFMQALGAGCTVPAGALATLDGDEVTVVAMLASPDGAVARVTCHGPCAQAAEVGARAAGMLRACKEPGPDLPCR